MNKRLRMGLGCIMLLSTAFSTTLMAAPIDEETQWKPVITYMEEPVEKSITTEKHVEKEEDPIVTKSYVDLKISELSNFGYGQINEQLQEKLNEQETLINKLVEQIMNHESSSQNFEIVTLKTGERIYGKQGTEMIVRSGEGMVIAADGGGIQDVTDGLDLPNEVIAPNNNLLIIPRNDGRGICAKRTTVIMVRGGYKIE